MRLARYRFTMPSRLPAAATLLLLAGTAALAHECWLEVPRFRLQPGQTANARPLVGENFRGASWSNRASKIRRFVRYGPALADSTDLTPAPGFAPTDSFRTAFTFAQPGTHMVVLGSTSSFIELPADKFTAYLREEGLDYALKLRQERGDQARPGRETYRRCAKALVQVGEPGPDSTFRRACSLPLELVPEQNPYRLTAGKAMTVRVLRAGRPAPGTAVQVWQRQPGGLPTTHFITRTNQSGRLLLRLSGPGPYLLAVVDMVEAPPALRIRAEWQSTWASLTFAGPPTPTPRRAPKR